MPVRALTLTLAAVALLATGAVIIGACGSTDGTEGGGGAGGAAPEACSPDGTVAYCYPGPSATLNVGECHSGSHTCQDGFFGACTGYTAPATEICNDGLDNDCNGVADEGCSCSEGTTRPCYTGPAATGGIGLCHDGVQSCVGGTWAASCDGQVLPAVEACDHQDNDCNGVIDDGCPCADGDVQPCYSGPPATKGVGLCHGGQQICANGQWPPGCAGEVTPHAEQCDGDDNDCNGQTDENDPGSGGSCNSGQPGVCAAGTHHCQGGSLVCTADQGPSAEVCDGQDNNCNGQVDEGNPGGGGGCNTGLQGVCAAGTLQCQGGSLQCAQNQGSSAEICDGQDNNCNGQVDEGNPGGGAACNTGLHGECAYGTTQCQGGSVQCIQDYTSEPEVCDGLDNNCNGSTDEGVHICGVGWICTDGYCEPI